MPAHVFVRLFACECVYMCVFLTTDVSAVALTPEAFAVALGLEGERTAGNGTGSRIS